MPRWKETLQQYAHWIWWSVVGLLATACIGLIVFIFVSGGSETGDAVHAGRRLVIALDTGEIEGARIDLDGNPIIVKPPEEKPVETPPAATPDTPPAEGAGETPPETPVAQAPSEPARPTAEPNPELMEKGDAGMLPIIGSDGTKPWRYYGQTFERTNNRPMIAIVVTGLGEGRAVTQAAIDLPQNMTLSFSPYARDNKSWGTAVRATGHELLIDLPLQPTNYPATDPGPKGLILERGEEVALMNLRWTMTRYPAYIGMMTPQNESFTANDQAMKLLLQSMANRGLLLVIGREPHKKETRDIIDASHTAALVADSLIDEELSATAIQTRLSQLEDRAKMQGYAVGVAQAYPLTMEQLRAWAASLEAKGILLVPLTAIAKLRFS